MVKIYKLHKSTRLWLLWEACSNSLDAVQVQEAESNHRFTFKEKVSNSSDCYSCDLGTNANQDCESHFVKLLSHDRIAQIHNHAAMLKLIESRKCPKWKLYHSLPDAIIHESVAAVSRFLAAHLQRGPNRSPPARKCGDALRGTLFKGTHDYPMGRIHAT